MGLNPKKTYIPNRSEEPIFGLQVDWYNNDEVIVYKLVAISAPIVEKWAEYVQSTLKDWPKDQPYLAIHDLSQGGISLQYAALVNFDLMNIGVNADGRSLCEYMFDEHVEWRGRVALNFNLSVSGQTNRALMSNFMTRLQPAIEYKTFYNLTKSLIWLTTNITDTSEMKAVEDKNSNDEMLASKNIDEAKSGG